jgi:hypothetical protein
VGVKVQFRETVFDVVPCSTPKRPLPTPEGIQNKPNPPKPVPEEHYYKYGQHLFPRLFYDESDQQILLMLEDIFLRRQT